MPGISQFDMLLRLVGLMHMILILSCWLSNQRREPFIGDFLNISVYLALHLDIGRMISFKPSMMVDCGRPSSV